MILIEICLYYIIVNVLQLKYSIIMIGIHKILCLSLNAHHRHGFCSLAVRKSVVDDYEVTSFLGKGSTSRVYQGYHIMTGT